MDCTEGECFHLFLQSEQKELFNDLTTFFFCHFSLKTKQNKLYVTHQEIDQSSSYTDTGNHTHASPYSHTQPKGNAEGWAALVTKSSLSACHCTSSSPEFLRTTSAPFQRLSSNRLTLENSGAAFTQRWLRGSAQHSSSCSKAARVTRKRWLQGRNSPPALTRTKSAGLGRRQPRAAHFLLTSALFFSRCCYNTSIVTTELGNITRSKRTALEFICAYLSGAEWRKTLFFSTYFIQVAF